MNDITRLIRGPIGGNEPSRPTSTPIYQTATFTHESVDSLGEFDYTRSGNPTRKALEDCLAALEGAAHSFAFTSGVAALSAVLRLVRPGEEILAGTDLYGGTDRLLEHMQNHGLAGVRRVDTSDKEAVVAAIRPATRLVVVETPSNPLFTVTDISATADAAHAHNALLLVDSSMMSPLLQKPLSHGADIVVHSGTKHLSGHGDVTAGIVNINDSELARQIAFIQNAEGAALAPFEAWLLLRGVKTIEIRLERQQRTAIALAEFLDDHDAVEQVYFPAFAKPSDIQIHEKQSHGPGCVLSFTTGDANASRQIVNALRYFGIAVSFGSVASQCSLPGIMSHANADRVPSRAPLPADLVRLSVGLESLADLKADLLNAFEQSKSGACRSLNDGPSLPQPSIK